MSFSSEVVVKGEAIESDEDSDDGIRPGHMLNNIRAEEAAQVEYHGVVLSGEAPESDDEILAFSNVKIGSAREITEAYQPLAIESPNKPKTLLQQMLVDRNKLLWHHLNQCVQSTVVTASSQIIASEQLLIQTQMTLQAASRLIKQANETADHIHIKCNDILTADFLPEIKVPME